MQVSLTLVSTNDREARSLSGILDLVTSGLQVESGAMDAIETKALPSGGKKAAKDEKLSKKAPKVEVEETSEDDFSIDDESSDDVESGDDFDFEEEPEVEKSKKGPGRPPKSDDSSSKKSDKPIDQKQMISAFKEYAQTNGRDKAGKILEKFKVKSVRDLDAKHYPKALELLSR